MRTIILLRHAHAMLLESSGKDFDRPLSRSGQNDASNQAHRLLQAGYQPDFILSSPACRTLQTAEIFNQAIAERNGGVSAALCANTTLYRADAEGYLAEIIAQTPSQAQCVLVVGHNPSIEDCIMLFAASNPALAQRISGGLATCGLAILNAPQDFCALTPATATLTALYLPEED